MIGDWDNPYDPGFRLRGRRDPRAGQDRRPTATCCAAPSRCTGASTAARRWPRRRSNTRTRLRRRSTWPTLARDAQAAGRALRRDTAGRCRGRRADLDHHPVDAAGLAGGVSLGAEMEYVLVEGPAARRHAALAGAGRGAGRACAAALWRRRASSCTATPRARALESLLLAHPFYAQRDIPLLLGDHVSDEDGTGAVHTAPGHGQEDFVVGQQVRPGRQVHRGADQSGRRPRRVPALDAAGRRHRAGRHCTSGRPTTLIVEVLRANGCLLAFVELTHSYPHCWRHKTPVVFRATPQWFISMDQANLRRDALAAIDDRRLVPGVGQGAHRRHGRRPPGLVHLPPAHLGRADRAVRPSRNRRAASAHASS